MRKNNDKNSLVLNNKAVEEFLAFVDGDPRYKRQLVAAQDGESERE